MHVNLYSHPDTEGLMEEQMKMDIIATPLISLTTHFSKSLHHQFFLLLHFLKQKFHWF